MTWGWGSGDSSGRLWRICTAPDANTRCQAANKDLSVSGQVLDLRYGYDNVGNVTAIRDKINSSQMMNIVHHKPSVTTILTGSPMPSLREVWPTTPTTPPPPTTITTNWET